MTVKNYRKMVGIGIVSVLLFLTGSVQAYLHYYDTTQELFSRVNLRAVSMGAMLGIAEFVFLYADWQLMGLRSRGKRLVVGISMGLIALSMAWTIGSEFAASMTETKSQAGLAIVEQYRENELATAKKRERAQIRESAREMAQGVVTGIVSADVRAYLVNFIVALVAFVVCQFCEEKDRRAKKSKTESVGGNQIPLVPGLASYVENQMGLPAGAVNGYDVPGGWAIWQGREYQGFAPMSAVEREREHVGIGFTAGLSKTSKDGQRLSKADQSL